MTVHMVFITLAQPSSTLCTLSFTFSSHLEHSTLPFSFMKHAFIQSSCVSDSAPHVRYPAISPYALIMLFLFSGLHVAVSSCWLGGFWSNLLRAFFLCSCSRASPRK